MDMELKELLDYAVYTASGEWPKRLRLTSPVNGKPLTYGAWLEKLQMDVAFTHSSFFTVLSEIETAAQWRCKRNLEHMFKKPCVIALNYNDSVSVVNIDAEGKMPKAYMNVLEQIELLNLDNPDINGSTKAFAFIDDGDDLYAVYAYHNNEVYDGDIYVYKVVSDDVEIPYARGVICNGERLVSVIDRVRPRKLKCGEWIINIGGNNEEKRRRFLVLPHIYSAGYTIARLAKEIEPPQKEE
jgi:hypothetical protein